MPVATTRKLNEYEKNALLAMDDAAGEYAAEHGADIGEYTEEQRMALWRLVISAWATSLTEQAAGGGAPF